MGGGQVAFLGICHFGTSGPKDQACDAPLPPTTLPLAHAFASAPGLAGQLPLLKTSRWKAGPVCSLARAAFP